jgi:PAS domain S-box-containing protein
LTARSKSTSRKVASRPKRASAHPHRSRRLLESAEQFRLAQEALGIVTWIWDIPGDRVQWYGDAARLLGLPPRSFSGRYQDYLKLVHPDDAAMARATLVECIKGARPEYRNTERVVWLDGSIHWLETYGRADYGHDGRAVRMTGVITEVTDRKQQESARERAEGKFAALFEHSPDAISLYRLSDGVRLEANAAWERLSGYSRSQVAGHPATSAGLFRSPEHRAAIIARVEAEGSASGVQARLVRADGSVMDAAISAVRIELDGQQCILWCWRDVTVEREIARRARQSERKFQALFETSSAGLILTQPRERKVLEINDAALHIVGLKREQAVGAQTAELAKILNPELFEELRARALAGERVSGYLGIERRDGRRLQILITAALVEIDREAHLIISILDVTEQRGLGAMPPAAEHQ